MYVWDVNDVCVWLCVCGSFVGIFKKAKKKMVV